MQITVIDKSLRPGHVDNATYWYHEGNTFTFVFAGPPEDDQSYRLTFKETEAPAAVVTGGSAPASQESYITATLSDT